MVENVRISADYEYNKLETYLISCIHTFQYTFKILYYIAYMLYVTIHQIATDFANRAIHL